MSRNSFPMKFIWSSVQNVTTGASCVLAVNPVGAQTYGVLITATSNTWIRFSDPVAGGAIASASQTVANPGVFTTATQAFSAGLPVYISGAAAPGGFVLGQVYYVIATGLTTTACELAATPGGTGIQCTSSAACTLNPITAATATNSLLVKSTDFAEEYGIAPGQYIATLQQTATGTVNIVELTH
jgi:hypothetical protein